MERVSDLLRSVVVEGGGGGVGVGPERPLWLKLLGRNVP